MPIKPKRRKVSLAAGLSAGRDTLIADIRADAQERRVKEHEEKQTKAEKWAQESNRLKSLAEKYQDDEITLSMLREEMKASRASFPDNSAIIDSVERAAIRNRDTVKFNTYKAAGMTLEDFEAYTKLRQKDGGDISHLTSLLAQARVNEDHLRYQAYLSTGDYDAWKEYSSARSAQGGNLEKLQGFISAAQNNERKVQMNLHRSMYEAGSLSGTAYEKFLTDMLGQAVSPTDAAAIRTAITAVRKNEFTKGVNEIIDDLQSGAIDDGQALVLLHAKVGETNDAELQKAVQKNIAQIKSNIATKGAKAASEAQTRLKDYENGLDETYKWAKDDHEKAVAAAFEASGKGPQSFNSASAALVSANRAFTNFIVGKDGNEGLSSRTPSEEKKVQWKGYANDLVNGESTAVWNLAQTTVKQMRGSASGDSVTPPNIDRDIVSFYLRQVATNPFIGKYSTAAAAEARRIAAETQERFFSSEKGQRWNNLVFRMTEAFRSNDAAFAALNKHYGNRFSFGKEGVSMDMIEQIMVGTGGAETLRRLLQSAGSPEFSNYTQILDTKNPKGETVSAGAPKTTENQGMTAGWLAKEVSELLPEVFNVQQTIREVKMFNGDGTVNPNSSMFVYVMNQAAAAAKGGFMGTDGDVPSDTEKATYNEYVKSEAARKKSEMTAFRDEVVSHSKSERDRSTWLKPKKGFGPGDIAPEAGDYFDINKLGQSLGQGLHDLYNLPSKIMPPKQFGQGSINPADPTLVDFRRGERAAFDPRSRVTVTPESGPVPNQIVTIGDVIPLNSEYGMPQPIDSGTFTGGFSKPSNMSQVKPEEVVTTEDEEETQTQTGSTGGAGGGDQLPTAI